MLALKPGKYLERLLIWATPPQRKPHGLVEAAEDAKRTWLQALNDLNYIDNSFVDYAVHNINAAERRYVALVQQAKKEGLTAWPDYPALNELPTEDTGAFEAQTNHKEAISRIPG